MICMYIGFLIVVFMGLFLIFNEGYDMGVWVCVMLVGFVLFIIFFIMFIWIEEEFLMIIGKVVLLFLIVLLLGMMVNFIVFGILMDRLMLMWFCYLLFIESVLFLVFYLLVYYVVFVVYVLKIEKDGKFDDVCFVFYDDFDF